MADALAAPPIASRAGICSPNAHTPPWQRLPSLRLTATAPMPGLLFAQVSEGWEAA
jgi:hypothetical protein